MSDADKKAVRRLRPGQVLASTLAATTGAFLAAQLGVYGTVIGVGVMSLITTIGTELYIRSLERTRQAARFASRGKAVRGHGVGAVAESAAALGSGTPGNEAGGAEEPTDEVRGAEEAAPGAATNPGADAAAHRPFGRLRWSFVAAGTAVAFVLAMIVVTGIETVSGSTLSGAEGSTVGKIVTGDTGQDDGTSRDENDQGPAPSDAPTEPGDDPEEPGSDPTGPESTTGDEEETEDGGSGTTEPPAEDDTTTDEESPPAEEDGDDPAETPDPDEEPEPVPEP